MTTIGFIGLGAMGSRIAGRLLAAGHHVYGTNRTAGRAAALHEAGLDWRDTPPQVAAQANRIFTMGAAHAARGAGPSRPGRPPAPPRPRPLYLAKSTVTP